MADDTDAWQRASAEEASQLARWLVVSGGGGGGNGETVTCYSEGGLGSFPLDVLRCYGTRDGFIWVKRKSWKPAAIGVPPMVDLFAEVPIDEQIAVVKREIAMRRSVYPRLVANQKMTAHKAERELAAMEAVMVTLERVRGMTL